VHQQHVIVDRARERDVDGVGDVGARHEVVAGAEHELRLGLRDGELGDRPERHAAPVVVVPAPRRHAVEIADVLGLRQREELFPRQREKVVDEAADLELPGVERNLGLLAQIENRPVLHLVLADRQLRHPMAVARAGALRPPPAKRDVDGALVQLDLALNVFSPALDEIVCAHGTILSNRASHRGDRRDRRANFSLRSLRALR
jgi:hypothetical protein